MSRIFGAKEGFKAEWIWTWFFWSHLALDNFKDGLYDLFLLDIKMPEMDGLHLYQEMKKIDNKVNVCFLTARRCFMRSWEKKNSSLH